LVAELVQEGAFSKIFLRRNGFTNMKRLVAGFLMSLSLASIFLVGIGSRAVRSQVFRCSDTSLGENEREEVRGNDSRAESRVAVGQDCEDANWHEYLNEQDRRDAELENQRMQDWREQSERRACQLYGINSPNCTHEGLRRQAQQEQEVERQRQQEAARIQQEAERENYFRQSVAAAQARVRQLQEDIAFWSDRPEMRQQEEQMLPLAEADLRRAEQELQNYLNQR
jgi:hypothetical protein